MSCGAVLTFGGGLRARSPANESAQVLSLLLLTPALTVTTTSSVRRWRPVFRLLRGAIRRPKPGERFRCIRPICVRRRPDLTSDVLTDLAPSSKAEAASYVALEAYTYKVGLSTENYIKIVIEEEPRAGWVCVSHVREEQELCIFLRLDRRLWVQDEDEDDDAEGKQYYKRALEKVRPHSGTRPRDCCCCLHTVLTLARWGVYVHTRACARMRACACVCLCTHTRAQTRSDSW